MFNCKLPFDAICKLNAKLQTEQAGRAGEAYTHTHHVTQIPDDQFRNHPLLCALLGGPYVEILFFACYSYSDRLKNYIYIHTFVRPFH